MNKLAILLAAVLFHPLTASEGDILILSGPSSCGKSTIARNLINIEPDRFEEDLDLRRDPREPTKDGVLQQMIDDAIDRALRGERVLFHNDLGAPFFTPLRERNLTIPTRNALIFAQFDKMIERLESRNQKAKIGDIRELRNPLVPLDQYARIYTRKLTEGKGLETLTRSHVEVTYNAHFDKMIAFAREQGNSLPSDEQIPLDKKASLIEFLTNLGFTDNIESIEVEPKNATCYDLIFDNTQENNFMSIVVALHK